MKKVSLIIPVYNGENVVEKCIEKIQQQTYRNIEVVFVDDCSDDCTCDIVANAIRNDSRFLLVKRDVHTDPFQCRKAGFFSSTGDIVVYLDADDFLVPNACSIIVETFKKNNVDMFIYGSLVSCSNDISQYSSAITQKYLDRHLRTIKKTFLISNYKFLLSPNLWPLAVWNKAIKRECLEKAFSLYSPKMMMPYAQDVVQSLLSFLSVKSIYANTKLKLHRYSLGAGATDKSISGLSWEKFIRISSAANTTRAITEVTDLFADQLGDCAKLIKEKFIYDIFSNTTKYLQYLPKGKIAEGIDSLYNQWGPMLFASPMFYSLDVEKYKSEILTAKCFQNKKTDINNVVLYYHHLGVGGVQTCLRLLSNVYKRAGFNLFVVTDLPVEDYDKIGFAEGTKFISLSQKINEGNKFNAILRTNAWEKIIKNNNIDVVYYSSYENENMVSDILTIHSQQAYVVVHMHSVFSSAVALGYPNVLRKSLIGFSFSDAIVTLSRESQFFFNSLGMNAYYFPNPPTFSKEFATGPRTNPKNKRIVWCGRISPGKQLLEAIKIFNLARQEIPELKMTILGDAVPKYKDLKNKAVRYAKRVRCYDSIEWVGYKENVHPYYLESDILLSTSVVEGFPMTFLEVYSMGVPIVLYDLSCVESIKTPFAAHVVQNCDYTEAAYKIVQLFKDTELYAKSSRVAFSEYSKFSNFDQLTAWKELFLDLPKSLKKTNTDGLLSSVLLTLIDHSSIGVRMANISMMKRMSMDAFIVRVAIFLQKALNRVIIRFFK